MKRFSSREEAFSDPDSGRRIEEHLDRRGGVNDDHRRSRSALTALAGETRVTTDLRCASRALSSATVGRSAVRRTSWSR